MSLVLVVASCGPGDRSRTDPYGTSSEALTVCGGGSRLLGLDVSEYQGSINWGAVRGAEVRWAYAKATEGTGFRDPTFPTNWSGMAGAGVYRGAYHFFHPSENGTAQADYFLAYAGNQNGVLPPMLDWEVTDSVSGTTAGVNAQLFINEIRARTGRETIIYTTPGLWAGFHVPQSFSGNPLWVADWLYCDTSGCCPVMPGSWTNWTFWQFNDNGTVNGIGHVVDEDVFNGTETDLANLAGVPTTCGGTPSIPAAPSCGTIRPGQGLGPGDSVTACGGCYTLVMQTDGNLVEYQNSTGRALWATSTNGRGYVFDMQGDGNAVVYSNTSCPSWASNTAGRSNAFFAVQDDGNLVVYSGLSAVWASNTDVCPGGCQCYAPLTITPGSATVRTHASMTFTPSGGSGGYQWSIPSNASGGSISGGNYTAGSVGNVTDVIRLQDSNGHSTTANVTVLPALMISPPTVTTPPRGTVNFSVTGATGAVTWTLRPNPSGGAISAAGLYVAGVTGNVTDVVVASDTVGNTATAPVTVGPGPSIAPSVPGTPPRGTIQFTATGGSGTGFSWSLITNASGGTIAPSGVYVAGVTGSVIDAVQVTDSLGNQAVTTIKVGPGVSVSPASPKVPPRGTIALTPSGGSGTGFVWSVLSAPSGGSLTLPGVYVAGSVGNSSDMVQVTDSLGNSTIVIITVGPPAALSPAAPTTPPLGSIPFHVSGGSGTGWIWTLTSAPSGGTVSNSGLYKAGTIGNTTDVLSVTDSLGNTATASITVGPGVSITPSDVTAPPRGKVTFSAFGGSGSGFVWSLMLAPSGGTITAAGVYTAGTTPSVVDTVLVTDSLGNTNTTTVDVGPGVTLTPPSAMVAPQETQRFVAGGGSETGFIWVFLSNQSGATLSTTGIYLAGTTPDVTDTILVTDSLGNSASADVQVSAGVTITPSGAVVAPMGTTTFTASGGSGTGYVWTVPLAASGGSITQQGVYTAGPVAMTVDTVQVIDSLGNKANALVSVGGGLAILPPGVVPPLGTVTLSALGGSGSGYGWSLLQAPSGGTISGGGAYKAGPTPNRVDVAQVMDSNGNVATTQIVVGPGVNITPASPTVAPLGSVTFNARGGSGTGFVWALVQAPSHGSITSTGLYTAGELGGVIDTVQATDSLGNHASVDVTVSGGLSISPAQTTASPRQSLTFAASGGSGAGYQWTLTSNLSGGVVTDQGVYTAGTTGSVTDVLQLSDSAGDVVMATISVGAGVSISPANPTVAPLGSVTFSATGGSNAGYQWSLPVANSGGNINASGLYTAGDVPQVSDTVQVTDSLGNTASVTIAVGMALSIDPPTANVDTGQQQQFHANGGIGSGFFWSLDQSPSGGQISSTGLYTAGTRSGVTDIVRAADANGNFATATVKVSPRPPTVSAAPGCGCTGSPGVDTLALAVLLFARRRRTWRGRRAPEPVRDEGRSR